MVATIHVFPSTAKPAGTLEALANTHVAHYIEARSIKLVVLSDIDEELAMKLHHGLEENDHVNFTLSKDDEVVHVDSSQTVSAPHVLGLLSKHFSPNAPAPVPAAAPHRATGRWSDPVDPSPAPQPHFIDEDTLAKFTIKPDPPQSDPKSPDPTVVLAICLQSGRIQRSFTKYNTLSDVLAQVIEERLVQPVGLKIKVPLGNGARWRTIAGADPQIHSTLASHGLWPRSVVHVIEQHAEHMHNAPSPDVRMSTGDFTKPAGEKGFFSKLKRKMKPGHHAKPVMAAQPTHGTRRTVTRDGRTYQQQLGDDDLCDSLLQEDQQGKGPGDGDRETWNNGNGVTFQ
ncbi:hypothetical protein J8273_1064 [Carpediemonas membranifera]|uniref:Uncharacterized protein n=1 Tax=Carpediemonas membranifera TaxID=201153 RepID=A0A8J6B2S6_9EUKA|nr:hypothetical protein J8273_1064 [Carpediemonas membranifera]|eukprot:KAG9397155.1 hypothetical protein J8273_1064 [Carpediemonas membranifera]